MQTLKENQIVVVKAKFKDIIKTEKEKKNKKKVENGTVEAKIRRKKSEKYIYKVLKDYTPHLLNIAHLVINVFCISLSCLCCFLGHFFFFYYFYFYKWHKDHKNVSFVPSEQFVLITGLEKNILEKKKKEFFFYTRIFGNK